MEKNKTDVEVMRNIWRGREGKEEERQRGKERTP